MKKVLTYILFAISILLSSKVSAQLGNMTVADKYYANYNYPKAIASYKFILKRNDNENDKKHIYQRLANSFRLMGNYQEAEEWYSKLVQFKKIDPTNYFYYAKMLESNEKHEEARKWFEAFVEKMPRDSRARRHKEYSKETVAKLLEDKGLYEITNLNINTDLDDFSPVFYGESKVVYVSNKREDLLVSREHVWNGLPYLDLFITDRQENGDLVDPNPFSFFNTKYHEGPATFSKDLKKVYFTRNALDGSKTIEDGNNSTNLMIYASRKVSLENGDEFWTTPEVMDFNSKDYSCQHPTISADGNFLYFASDMPGGLGGMDLYVSEKKLLGWTRPKNLGPEINTSGDEVFPFISDKDELYYSSNGLLGLGGLDVFKATRNEDNALSDPENLGYPVNDVLDDFSYVLDKTNLAGYFTSNRSGGKGRDDIYRFTLTEVEEEVEEEKPVISNDIKVFVYDKVTGLGLSKAVVNVFTPTGELVNAIQVSDTGVYMSPRGEFNGELRFITTYPEYSTIRKIVTMEVLPDTNAVINLPLSKDLGKVLNLNPIYFDYDKANIRSDAALELDKVVKIMKENPTMVIEIASHTDSRGKKPYNEKLSDRRAKSSRQYIIANGVASSRIYGQGYGENQLTNQCEDGVECSEDMHQLNRRTEFRIIKF